MYIGNLNWYFAVSFLTYPNRCMLPLESRGCFFNLFILSLSLCNVHGLHDKHLLNKWIPIIFLHWRVKCNYQQIVLTLLLSLGIVDIAEKSVEMAQEEYFPSGLNIYGMSVMSQGSHRYLSHLILSSTYKIVITLPLQAQSLRPFLRPAS